MSKRLTMTFDDDTLALLEIAAAKEKRSVAGLVNWICFTEARRLTQGLQLDVEQVPSKKDRRG